LSEADSERLAKVEAGVAEIKQLVTKQATSGPDKEWFTTEEAAEVTSVSKYTLREACRTGRIPEEWSRKDDQDHWRIHRDAITSIQNDGLPPKTC
jgi:excisionase family DNA binding protein